MKISCEPANQNSKSIYIKKKINKHIAFPTQNSTEIYDILHLYNNRPK